MRIRRERYRHEEVRTFPLKHRPLRGARTFTSRRTNILLAPGVRHLSAPSALDAGPRLPCLVSIDHDDCHLVALAGDSAFHLDSDARGTPDDLVPRRRAKRAGVQGSHLLVGNNLFHAGLRWRHLGFSYLPLCSDMGRR